MSKLKRILIGIIIITLFVGITVIAQTLSGPNSPTATQVPTFVNNKRVTNSLAKVDTSGNITTPGYLETSSDGGTDSGIIWSSGDPVTLTESAATRVINVTIVANTYVGIKIHATTFARDSAEFQCISEEFCVSVINKAGTVTTSITASPLSSGTATSSGTLSTTWTAVANGESVDIKCSAVSSLTQTVLQSRAIISINRSDVVTITQ